MGKLAVIFERLSFTTNYAAKKKKEKKGSYYESEDKGKNLPRGLESILAK